MTEEANGNQQAASTENGAKPPEIDYEAKYKEAVAHSRKWEKLAKDNKTAADELQQLKEAQLSEAEKTAKHIKELEAKNAAYEAENSRTNGRRRSPRKPACPSHCSTAPPSKKCKPTARRSPTTSPRRPSRRCTPPPNPTSLPRHPAHPAIGFAISSSSRNANNPPHRKKV